MKSSGGLKPQENRKLKLLPRRKTKFSVSFSLMPAAQEIMNDERLRSSNRTGIPLKDQVLQQAMHKWLYFGFPIISILTILKNTQHSAIHFGKRQGNTIRVLSQFFLPTELPGRIFLNAQQI